METEREPLWPYSRRAALLAAPICWLVFAAAFVASRRLLNWPDAEAGKLILILVTAISFVPTLLSLVDYIASSRASVDIKGFKINFSQALVTRATIELPPNMGKAGPVVSDSSPMEIVATLETATSNKVVQIDLKDGDEWWVTRLMALCAGADRAGSPKAIVFVGRKNNTDGIFLGWSPPVVLLDVLRKDRQGRGPASVTYGSVYEKARRIAKQVDTFSDSGAPPPPRLNVPWDVPPTLPSDVRRYLNDPKYAGLGEAVLEQILMDQLGLYELEALPDRLNLNRLEELFSPYLYRDAIGINWSKEKQAEVFVESEAPFLAVVNGGRYQALVERAEIERSIINELLRPRSSERRETKSSDEE